MPPPVKKPDDLAEVEAALSVLGGRHPDHVRRERETTEAIEAKRQALDAESRRDRNRKLKIGGVVLLGVSAFAYGIVRAQERERIEDAALQLVVAPATPFLGLGFSPLEAGGTHLGARHADRAEGEVEAGTCVIAVAATAEGPASFLLERDGDKIDAKGSIGFCTCAHENVTATVTSGAGTQRAVRLLRKDARSFGGTYGFARTDVQPQRVLDSPCAEEHLDGWLADPSRGRTVGTAAKPPLADSPLTKHGFSRLATGVASGPFVVLEPPFSSCTYVSSNQPDDRLSLRIAGGTRVLADVAGPIAFCDSHANTYVVFRSGHALGELSAVGAPSRRVGGLIGVREASLQAGLPAPATWIRPEDLAWDAGETARASGIPEIAAIDYASAAPNKPSVHDARILSLSTTDGATVVPDTADLVFYTCSPELGKAPQNFCVQASPQRWRDTSTRGRAAGAEANLPYWLAVFAPAHDPELVRVEARLLALARRLTRAGFDPTVLEAVTELPNGVDVAGRAGEDAIVAIALEPQAPWAVPCTNGPAWTIDGDPLVIELPAGKHALLTHTSPVVASKEARRTVVFRRTVKK